MCRSCHGREQRIMPTGYTAVLLDKPETTFATFALRCARAMGYFVRMREDLLDAALPIEINPGEYERKQLDEAYARCRDLETVTPEEAKRRAEADYERQVKAKADAEARWAEENRIFSEMLAKANEWKAPPDHEGLKKFMAEQLQLSMHRLFEWTVHRRTGREWLAHERKEAAEALRRAAEEWEREQERARKATQWLADLRASVEEVTRG